MQSEKQTSLVDCLLSSWNWKCALLSATARSLVYLVALTRSGMRGAGSIILVEIGYVALTAGVYAGLQQRALSLRARAVGNTIVVLGVPLLAQLLDWTTHRLVGGAVSVKVTGAVCAFAVISALFHLHVMRNGVFLSGEGRSLSDDFRRIPRLLAEFVWRPVVLLLAVPERVVQEAESEAEAA